MLPAVRLDPGRELPQLVERARLDLAALARHGAPDHEGPARRRAHVDVAVDRGRLGPGEPAAQGLRLLEPQQGLAERLARHQQVPHEDVPLALVDVRPRAGVPAEVVSDRAPLVPLEGRHGVDERVVVDAHVRAVEGPRAPAAAHEHVAGDRRSPRDLEEEADERVLDPVVHEDAVAVADVPPDAVRVGVVDHQVVADGDPVGLVEDLDRGRVVAGELLDVVPPEDVPLEEHVGGADDVEALGRRVADQRVAQDEPVPAEVAADARAEGDRHVLERRAHDLAAVGPGLGRAHGVVGGLLGDEGRGLLPLDVDRPVGVLRERDPADRRPLPVGLLAVDRPAHAHEGAVEGGDLDRPARRDRRRCRRGRPRSRRRRSPRRARPPSPPTAASRPSTKTMSLLKRWSGVRVPSRSRCHQPMGRAGNSVFHDVRHTLPGRAAHSVATRVPLRTGRSSGYGWRVIPWFRRRPPVRYVPPRITIASPLTTRSIAASRVVGSARVVPAASAFPSGAT